MKKVKNISDQNLHLIGIGNVEAGAEIEVEDDFHNANFEEIEVAKPKAKKSETKKEEE